MKTKTTGMLVATLGAFALAAGATANELRFSDLEHRLATVERHLDKQQGVRPASYLFDDDADISTEAMPAPEPQPCEQPCCDARQACRSIYYAEVQLLMVRPHVNEDWVGKLSEEHHPSTRWVVGYEDCCGVGSRLRYWHFDHSIDILDPARIGMRVEVVDMELTNHLYFRSTDVMLAGGLRYTDWDLDDDNGDGVGLNAYGLTMAADARTCLCEQPGSRWSFIYGGRMSILGGNWHGDNDIIDTVVEDEVRDDNLLVTELYTGAEYIVRANGCDFFGRLTIELQNWRSDVLSEPGIGNPISPNAVASTNSIGFLNFGFHVGAAF